MTEDRRDQPPPRPPLTVRTLVIASVASIVGALVVTRLGYAGKLAGAGLLPIVVLLVSEFSHRSSKQIEKAAEKVVPVVITRHRPGGRTRHVGEPPTTILPGQAAPSEGEGEGNVEREVEGETVRLPPAPPPPAGSSRPYAVHVSEQRARRTTRNRLAGVLVAAACGLAIAVAGFTLLSAATGGHVNAGVRVATVHQSPSGKTKSDHTSDQKSSSTSSDTSTSKDTTTKGPDSSTTTSTTSTAPTTTARPAPGTTAATPATTETAPTTAPTTTPGTTSGTPSPAQTTPAATPPPGTGG